MSHRRWVRNPGTDERAGGSGGSQAPAPAQAQSQSPSEALVPSNPLASRPPHFPARAKRVIFLFMNGGPSHVDTFDPKPMLAKYAGQRPKAIAVDTQRPNRGGLLASPFKARPHGQSGIEVSELFPHLAGCIDDLCVIRSLYTDNPNHEPSLLMMNSGNMQPIRPCLGSWLTFGLGTENQNLPGFFVLCPGKPVVGPQLWSNSFLPGIYQGTHINNASIDPAKIIRDVRSRHLPAPPSVTSLTCFRRSIESIWRRAAATRLLKHESPRWRWPIACSLRPARLSTWLRKRPRREPPTVKVRSRTLA